MTDPTIASAVADVTTEIAAATPPPTPAGDPAAQPTSDPAATTDTPTTDPAAEAPPAKPDPAARRIANLTRKMGDAERERAAAVARADAAEALLAAARTADPEKAPATPPRPTVADADVEARAARLLAEREANQTREKVVAAGVKEFGEKDWNDRAAVLQEFGATTNTGFMEALLAAENPTAIVAALTDDTGVLEDLMRKTPAAIGTALGRMDAGFAKPAAKPISQAPKPAARVDPGGGTPTPDIYDPKMSMADFQREMDKILPPHLGGKRKVA